jgi:hypothetical protein
VREALEWPALPVRLGFVVDAVHGERLVAWARTDRGLLKAYLQAVDPSDGTWALRTAFVSGKQKGSRWLV